MPASPFQDAYIGSVSQSVSERRYTQRNSIEEKYINWRKTVKKNTDETINHSLTPILKACKKAAIEGYISHTLNNSIQCMRYPKENADRIFCQCTIQHREHREVLVNLAFSPKLGEPPFYFFPILLWLSHFLSILILIYSSAQ